MKPVDSALSNMSAARMQSVVRSARAADGEDARELVQTARKLEGVFLNMVFEEMAKTVPKEELFGNSPGLDMVQSWLRTELSERWAHSGGVGLGDHMARRMGGSAVDLVLDSPGGPFPTPVEGPVTSGFGMRTHPVTGAIDEHQGVDIATPVGSPVRAPFPGEVIDVGEHPRLGNTVTLQHAGGYRTLYGHIEKSNVEIGQRVSAGEAFAQSGATGQITGPHLHFAMYLNGRAVDPSRWIPELKTVEPMTLNEESASSASSL